MMDRNYQNKDEVNNIQNSREYRYGLGTGTTMNLNRDNDDRAYYKWLSEHPGPSKYQGYFSPEQDRGFYGKGPKGWKRSDERIKDEVSQVLYESKFVDASDLEVDVNDGVVTLTGSVDNRFAKREAENCIENLTGVNDIQNRIKIRTAQH